MKYLDTLFREGLAPEKMPPVATEQGWAGMEQRLDKHDRRRRLLFWLRTAGGAGLLIALVILFGPGGDDANRISLTPADTTQTASELRLAQKPENTKKPEGAEMLQGAETPEAVKSQNTQVPQGDQKLQGAEQMPEAGKSQDSETPQGDQKPQGVEWLQNGKRPQGVNRQQDAKTRQQRSDDRLTQNRGQRIVPAPLFSPASDLHSATFTVTSPGSPAAILGKPSPRLNILPGDRESPLHADTVPQAEGLSQPEDLSRSEDFSESENFSGPQGFYYGLSAGPDLTRVVPQPAMKTGYSAGLLVGYRFHPRWSAEAAVHWADKQYKTEGKYFDKEAAGFPSYLNLLSLDGGCHMLMVPLTVRYHFQLGNQSFFAGAGASTYFMTKEHYAYLAENSSGSRYEGHRQYGSSGNPVFSHLQLSAGYSYRLSSRILLRAEPYYHIPLKKVGIGNMPLTSAGLQLAIIRD